MDKANGIGALVSAGCICLAAITAECIPLCFLFVAIAALGVAYDQRKGNIKRAPRSGGNRYKVHGQEKAR